jgi:CheY-like chemotaxis protein
MYSHQSQGGRQVVIFFVLPTNQHIHHKELEAIMLSYQFTEDPKARPPIFLSVFPTPEMEAISLRGKRAVIVEDEGITQLQLKKMLQSEGIKVVGTASNGKEGVEFVLKERPDFVLMDIQMPEMDGLEATERILAEFHVCIVMLTAFSDEGYRQRATELGVSGYVLKPVTIETLIPQVKALYHQFHNSA